MSFTKRLERRPAVTFATLSLAWVFLLYWRAFQSPFLYDDLTIVQRNSTIASLHGALAYFGKAVAFSTDFLGAGGAYYRPLTWMSFALDHSLWGLWAPGYHLTNILLHWLNGCLGFLLLRRLGVSILPNLATCLVWLALPVNSEVVVWTSARSHCLVFLFLLLALLACCEYVKNSKPALLAAYFAAGLCALLSHELGILLFPFTAVVLLASGVRTWRLATPPFLTAILAFVIYEGMRFAAGGNGSGALNALWPVGLSYLDYLRWFLLPAGMSIERSTTTPAPTFSLSAAFALLAILAVVAVVLVLRKKAPDTAAGIAWGLLALLPVSGLVFLYQGVAERYDYMASAGLVFALISVYNHLRRTSVRKAYIALLSLWLIAGVSRLYARLGDWSTEERLYTASLRASPNSWVLLLNLGNTYLQKGDLTKATQTYEQALRANPSAKKAIINLGAALEMRGDLVGAERQFRRALSLDPANADTYSNLATVVYAEGRSHEAATLFRKAIELNPRDATSYFNLGLLYAHSGLIDVAAQLYEQALAINPGYTDAQRALAALRKK